ESITYENKAIGSNWLKEMIDGFRDTNAQLIELREENNLMKQSLCKLGEVQFC
ncbi:hypothetical protein LCGC14_3152910, partial [marine sediment metagenome]